MYTLAIQVTNVTGCGSDRDGGTFGCDTNGGQLITIQGLNLHYGMVRYHQC